MKSVFQGKLLAVLVGSLWLVSDARANEKDAARSDRDVTLFVHNPEGTEFTFTMDARSASPAKRAVTVEFRDPDGELLDRKTVSHVEERAEAAAPLAGWSGAFRHFADNKPLGLPPGENGSKWPATRNMHHVISGGEKGLYAIRLAGPGDGDIRFAITPNLPCAVVGNVLGLPGTNGQVVVFVPDFSTNMAKAGDWRQLPLPGIAGELSGGTQFVSADSDVKLQSNKTGLSLQGAVRGAPVRFNRTYQFQNNQVQCAITVQDLEGGSVPGKAPREMNTALEVIPFSGKAEIWSRHSGPRARTDAEPEDVSAPRPPERLAEIGQEDLVANTVILGSENAGVILRWDTGRIVRLNLAGNALCIQLQRRPVPVEGLSFAYTLAPFRNPAERDAALK